MCIKLGITLVFLFLAALVFGQVDLKHFDYSKVDSIALNFPKKKYKSFTEIAGPLTSNLETEQEKFRVIFKWITNNISYSYSNKSPDPKKALKKGKAVCSGYSNLLKVMCNSVGIECEVITGFSKTVESDINKQLKKTDHAWNSVKLNGKWYLVDATWAWGYQNEKKKFIKEYDETYFLADNEFFNKKHYPKEKKWLLSEKEVSKSNFKKSPIFHSNYLTFKIEIEKPKIGIIKMKTNDTLSIVFTTDVAIENVLIEINPKKPATELLLRKVDLGNGKIKYIATTKFDKPINTSMPVFINNRHALTYKLIVK